MQLTPEDKFCLEEIYIHQAVPTDQLRRDRAILAQIATGFNRLTGRDECPNELLRYMINRRKNADWPRLGDRARRFPPAIQELLDGEIDLLINTYIAIDIPLDEFLLRDELSIRLAGMFTKSTKRVLQPATLVAALMAYRKRGQLPCLITEQASTVRPFADIEEVVRSHRRATAN